MKDALATKLSARNLVANLAATHDQDAIAQSEQLFNFRRDEEHANALIGQLENLRINFEFRANIQNKQERQSDQIT